MRCVRWLTAFLKAGAEEIEKQGTRSGKQRRIHMRTVGKPATQINDEQQR
ncbi:hypothetical protein SBDP1_440014 [Syntrophobacter sp. SbD1]|nr:hypothetical protein SBDP1_440014 [Syntrophobacter sp. SbD1]